MYKQCVATHARPQTHFWCIPKTCLVAANVVLSAGGGGRTALPDWGHFEAGRRGEKGREKEIKGCKEREKPSARNKLMFAASSLCPVVAACMWRLCVCSETGGDRDAQITQPIRGIQEWTESFVYDQTTSSDYQRYRLQWNRCTVFSSVYPVSLLLL